MKNMIALLLCLSFTTITNAQKLTGLWYSSDSTRVYEITSTDGNTFTATIKSSTRKNDTAGYAVIKGLIYNSRKKRYEGVIYAVSDGHPDFVTIKFARRNANKIILKLDRMLVFDVAINWVRAGEQKNQISINN